MGLENRPKKTGKFLSFKEGTIVCNHASFTDWTGRIIDLDIQEDEYNKKKYRRVTLYVDGGEGMVQELSFDLGSGYGGAFCAMAPNIKFDRDIEISPGYEKKNGQNGRSKLFLRQDGANLKWYFSNSTDEKTKRPAPVETTVSGVKVLDWSKRNAWYEKVLAKIRKDKIVPATGGLAEYKPGPKGDISDNTETEVIDDLPF